MEEQQKIQLLALDVDGTLFGTDGKVTPASVEAIREAQKKRVQVVLASGRDYDGLPWDQLKDVRIDYVITTNGSAVYRTRDRKCLKEECLDKEKMIPLFEYILSKEVYLSVFIDGVNYTPTQCFPYVENMVIPDYVKNALRTKANRMEDMIGYLRKNDAKIQKATLNFQYQDGTYLNREEVKTHLEACSDINVVDGGFSNLEFTRTGVCKATGLKMLAEYLHVPMEHIMAVGDSENDIEMIEVAGYGIAMGNALDSVKAVAKDVTLGNDEDGVAAAIEKYIIGEK